jgi:hypothetical protein
MIDIAASAAREIQQLLPRIKSGSLRFWGVWFGRPYDNLHRIVSANAVDGCLSISFEGSELLHVWHPQGSVIRADAFSIGDADRVRWEWFYYGRPQTAANRYFEDFLRSGAEIRISTNVDWFSVESFGDPSARAVEIL